MLRRTFGIAAATTLAAAALTACSTGSTETDSADTVGTGSSASAGAQASAFPVTIDNANFGAVTIDKQPTRVAALGSQDGDNLLALGIVPVGVTKITWGGDGKGSTPWFEDKLAELGGTMPAQYDDSDSVPIDEIAKVAPDLILATNYSLTKQQYSQLSKIAPVIAYPGAPWTTSWQDSLTLDAKALGLESQGQQVLARTEQDVADAKAANPELAGKTFIWGALETTDLSSVSYYTPEDGRPEFLTSLGMVNAPIIEKLSKKGQFYGTVSAERYADLRSDVFLTYGEKAADAQTFSNDKLIGQIPAIKAGHLATFLADATALAGSSPDVLAIPYAIDHFVPKVVEALQ
ncbi:iron-siderophore ABC transporter substrate-binding protein [Nocardioides sp. BP30]|uniref:iron-siderophore ABC transporter substrate-binding protein n=1 Tax=Nocardioides sp. BP30 TaxID=3036374 RepID=UPI00246992A6|nr:iron-siderophore ABC transporter substrate-binding protein [Nocardioides sp. BP30]WGL52314.1 iron-siderophore ABC transporter substrate-binding protein [Nocardioides sp. BP30]